MDADGLIIEVHPNPAEAMSDGQQHRYFRSQALQARDDGRSRPVFKWQGRYFGPK